NDVAPTRPASAGGMRVACRVAAEQGRDGHRKSGCSRPTAAVLRFLWPLRVRHEPYRQGSAAFRRSEPVASAAQFLADLRCPPFVDDGRRSIWLSGGPASPCDRAGIRAELGGFFL